MQATCTLSIFGPTGAGFGVFDITLMTFSVVSGNRHYADDIVLDLVFGIVEKLHEGLRLVMSQLLLMHSVLSCNPLSLNGLLVLFFEHTHKHLDGFVNMFFVVLLKLLL